jgi:hypothetical protein
MKTIIDTLISLLKNGTFSKEKMPVLIPVRVVPKTNPFHQS